MSLFGKKKEEKKETGCGVPDARSVCCGDITEGICCIKVLGSGCKNCHTLYENTQEAVKSAGIDVDVEYITDLQKVMEYGVMSMPALVINDQVVSIGKVLRAEEIERLIMK